MKKQRSVVYYITIFVLAQIAWFSLLGLWIYWYVFNYTVFSEIDREIAPNILPDTTNLFPLISGLLLLVLLSVSMSLIFIYLNRQINLNRLYDTFIANVTHELKSPLSSIQLYLETIKKTNIPKQQYEQFINFMLTDIDRLNHLISSILYISALEQKNMAKKLNHNYQIYAAEKIVKEVIDNSANRFNLSGQALEISGDAPCPCVIDPNWLSIVFDNLFDNSIKYSGKDLKIRIKLECLDRYFIITFSDNGIGIKKKDHKKVFQKFQRIENPDSPNVKGTGLGLYWVKEIIKFHGGKIRISSDGINKGTTFTISLPIYKSSGKLQINRLLRLSREIKK